MKVKVLFAILLTSTLAFASWQLHGESMQPLSAADGAGAASLMRLNSLLFGNNAGVSARHDNGERDPNRRIKASKHIVAYATILIQFQKR